MVVAQEEHGRGVKRRVAGPSEPPPREISPWRVGLLLLVLAGVAFGAWRLIDGASSPAGASSDASPVYAPYVDVTQTPTYPFQLPSANPVSSVYLGFLVSDPEEPCTPSWGTYYTPEQAERDLDLDSRVSYLRQQGGSTVVSFGGRDNTELAVACRDQAALTDAYLEPVRRYGAVAIDLDLEGDALADTAANERRAEAIAAVQRELGAKAPPVWLTLPVSSAGLTSEGEAAVRAQLDAGVELAGVNAMAFDFGPDEGAEDDIVGTTETALLATQEQVRSLWGEAGLADSDAAAWGHLGMTVMIGVTDVEGQRLTTGDARQLAGFAERHGIPRVSIWSLNRDSECGGAFPRTGMLANTCSGVIQDPLEFTEIFSKLPGTKTARAEQAGSVEQRRTTVPRDVQARSPYPIWRPTAAYPTGYKVVWQGQIHEAKWWNQGIPPGSAEAASPAAPWQQIGPVPADAVAPEPVLLAKGDFPSWSPTTVYREGERVSFKGLPYRARWYTRGEQPLDELPVQASEPWEPLFTYPGEPDAARAEAGSR